MYLPVMLWPYDDVCGKFSSAVFIAATKVTLDRQTRMAITNETIGIDFNKHFVSVKVALIAKMRQRNIYESIVMIFIVTLLANCSVTIEIRNQTFVKFHKWLTKDN